MGNLLEHGYACAFKKYRYIEVGDDHAFSGFEKYRYVELYLVLESCGRVYNRIIAFFFSSFVLLYWGS